MNLEPNARQKEDAANSSVRNWSVIGMILLLIYVFAVENGFFDGVAKMNPLAKAGGFLIEPVLKFFL